MNTSVSVIERSKNKYKPVDVSKTIPLEFDIGHLLATDIEAEFGNLHDENHHHPNKWESSESFEKELLALSRDNAQLLINQLFSLPSSSDTEGLFVKLPAPVLQLPRARPVPAPKPKTKWENFAEKKGISKRTREFAMVYNKDKKEHLPRHGAKSFKNDPMNHWLEELD